MSCMKIFIWESRKVVDRQVMKWSYAWLAEIHGFRVSSSWWYEGYADAWCRWADDTCGGPCHSGSHMLKCNGPLLPPSIYCACNAPHHECCILVANLLAYGLGKLTLDFAKGADSQSLSQHIMIYWSGPMPVVHLDPILSNKSGLPVSADVPLRSDNSARAGEVKNQNQNFSYSQCAHYAHSDSEGTEKRPSETQLPRCIAVPGPH